MPVSMHVCILRSIRRAAGTGEYIIFLVMRPQAGAYSPYISPAIFDYRQNNVIWHLKPTGR